MGGREREGEREISHTITSFYYSRRRPKSGFRDYCDTKLKRWREKEGRESGLGRYLMTSLYIYAKDPGREGFSSQGKTRLLFFYYCHRNQGFECSGRCEESGGKTIQNTYLTDL